MQEFMILLKLDDDGKLQANFEEIRDLAHAYDNGSRTEQAYQAKIIELILKEGYEQGLEDMERIHKQIGFTLMHTHGNA